MYQNTGFSNNLVSKSVDYTSTKNDQFILVDSSGGNRIITLPSPVGLAGKEIEVIRTDTTTNVIRVNGASDFIWVDKTQKFVSDGSYWWVRIPYSNWNKYNITSNITGDSNWSTQWARAIPYYSKDGTWNIKVYAYATTTSSGGVVLQITGTSINYTKAQPMFGTTQGAAIYGFTNGATQFYMYPTSGTGTTWSINCDIELLSEPSWSNESKFLKQKI
jgi:hypothetical protein